MKSLKVGLTVLVIALQVSLLHTWFFTFVVGAYYRSASLFMVVLVGATPIGAFASAYYALRWLWSLGAKEAPKPPATLLVLALLAPMTEGCSYAQANVQTLVTNDCGVTWHIIKAGESVPKSKRGWRST